MENGIGNNDAATLALLSGGGYGGIGIGNRGYGAGIAPSNVLRENVLADGTALKAASDCHMDQLSAALDRISAQNSETRNILKLDEITKGQSDSEFRILDRQRDAEKQLYDNAAAAASCCCETQKLIVAENAKTRDLINSNTIADLNRQLSDCKSSNASLSTLNATQTYLAAQTTALLDAINQ